MGLPGHASPQSRGLKTALTFLGGTSLLELPRGRAHPDGRHDQVVNYRHVIHALRRKPMALLNLVYRDRPFPRDAYCHPFDALLEAGPERQARRVMVELLALAHERGCEGELAVRLATDLKTRQMPDLAVPRAAFAPDPASIPHVTVHLATLASYEGLLGAVQMGGVV
jgi:hypothetical protein